MTGAANVARGIPPGRQSGNRPQPTWPHNRRPLFSPTVSRTTASRKPHSSTTSSSNGTLDPCWLHDITSSPSHQTTQVTASISHRFSPSSRLELPARSEVDSWADSQATGRNHISQDFINMYLLPVKHTSFTQGVGIDNSANMPPHLVSFLYARGSRRHRGGGG